MDNEIHQMVGSASGLLFVSVVMPIRNEDEHIRDSLNSVLEQDYPTDKMEVIVADGQSTDQTRQIINKLIERDNRVHLIDNLGKIVPTGLNAAIQMAKGEIIIRVDGHTKIAPDYVRQCATELLTKNADNVGGRMSATGSGIFGEAVALATSSPFGVGGARFHYSDREEWVDTVYMGAWRRVIFEQIGLFDEELVRDQDDEFNYRLRENGGRILLSPKIKSQYAVRSSPRTLWRQYYQYGYWKVRVLQKHPLQMRLRQYIPPSFVMTLLITSLLAMVFPVGKYVLILTMGLYLFANLIASFLTSNWNYKIIATLLVVYSILHLSYGLGFIVGFVSFLNRWKDRDGKVPKLTLVQTELSID